MQIKYIKSNLSHSHFVIKREWEGREWNGTEEKGKEREGGIEVEV